MLAEIKCSNTLQSSKDIELWQQGLGSDQAVTKSHTEVYSSDQKEIEEIDLRLFLGTEQNDITLSESPAIGMEISDMTPIWPESRKAHLIISKPYNELVSQNESLKYQLKQNKMIIDKLTSQIREFERKKELLSVAFDLPDDYYENDEYLLE